MSATVPRDPFLVDALGCSRFVRDLLKKFARLEDFDAAVYWAARCAGHWAMRSQTWRQLS